MKIEDICTRICSGGTPKSDKAEYYENGTIPWLNTKEINFNRIQATEAFITEERLNNSSAKWIKPHTVIVAMYGATAGRVAVAEIPLTTNQACCNLEVDETIADYRYIYYWLKQNFDNIAGLANGGAQQNLSAKVIRQIEINLPDLIKQRSIANFLDSFDSKIEANAKLNGYLEELVSLMFDHLIGSCTETVPFSTYATISSGKRPPIKSPNYTDECVFPLFGATSQMGYTSEYLTDEKLLVIGRVGTHGVVQRVSGKAWPSDNTLVIRSEHYETASQLLQRVDYSSLNRGSTQPLITQGDLKAYEVPFINTASLERFENKSSQLMALYDHNSSESAKLTKLRDTLLPRLMSGEIDVSGVAF